MAELEKLHEECKADPKQVVHGHTGLRNEEAAPAVMLSVKLEVSLPRLLGFVQALQPQVLVAQCFPQNFPMWTLAGRHGRPGEF